MTIQINNLNGDLNLYTTDAAQPSGNNSSAANSRQKKLFSTTEGDENQQRTTEESNRFMNYLSDHHLGQRQLDCSRDNPIIKAIICFCVKWKRLKYIDKPSPAAVLRFLTETCGISCAAEAEALSTFIGRMLKTDYDKNVFCDVEDYFN